MKVLVCGGRDYDDVVTVYRVLAAFERDGNGITLLINGGAQGADHLAAEWAKDGGIPVAYVPANWTVHGKAAGPIRNVAMLQLGPDVVVAFPGGRGTADMVRKAKDAGIRVMEIANDRT